MTGLEDVLREFATDVNARIDRGLDPRELTREVGINDDELDDLCDWAANTAMHEAWDRQGDVFELAMMTRNLTVLWAFVMGYRWAKR